MQKIWFEEWQFRSNDEELAKAVNEHCEVVMTEMLGKVKAEALPYLAPSIEACGRQGLEDLRTGVIDKLRSKPKAKAKPKAE